MDIVDIIFAIPEKLKELTEVLRIFLFEPLEIAGTEISGWMILSGIGIIGLLIYSIVRS